MSTFDRFFKDARSYALPHLRRLRGWSLGRFNDIANSLGVHQRTEEPLRQQWMRILRRSGDILDRLPESNGPRILLATVQGLSHAKLTLESILGMALRLRGALPTFLLCDKTLPACEWNRSGNFSLPTDGFGPAVTNRSRLDLCRYCTQAIQDPFELMPIPQITFGELLQPEDLERAAGIVDRVPYGSYKSYVHRDVAVGEHAFSTVMRATLRGTLLDDAETRWLFRRYLIAAILVADLAERAFDRVRPERVVAHHGIYVTHGTLCEVARKRGIPVVVHGIPWRMGTVVFSHGDTYHRTLTTEPNSEWENMELSRGQDARLQEYLASKRLGGRDYISYHVDAVDDPAGIVNQLRLDPNRPIVSLFTNVLWDAQLYYKYNAFDNMLEWLFETIRYFERRPDLQLVIRIHPGEARGAMPTRQPLLPEIWKEFPVLSDNIRVVPPEERISSYTLAEMSLAALIYGARMGVEIALCGTPLVVAGETFNRRKGFSYDAETREEYFALLDRIKELPRNSQDMLARARRYAYHLNFRRMIDFPFFSVKEGLHLSDPRLEFRSLHDLEPGKHRGLDTICDGILHEKPFVYDN